MRGGRRRARSAAVAWTSRLQAAEAVAHGRKDGGAFAGAGLVAGYEEGLRLEVEADGRGGAQS
jgi:hypothetical protein